MSTTINTQTQSRDAKVSFTASNDDKKSNETVKSSDPAPVVVMNWLMAAQDVMKSQTQAEYEAQASALNALDLRSAAIDKFNEQYAKNVDKMGDLTNDGENKLSKNLKIAGMVLLVVAAVALLAVATLATGGLAGAGIALAAGTASFATVGLVGGIAAGIAGAGCLIGSSAKEQDNSDEMDTTAADNQYLLSRIGSQQTLQSQDSQTLKMHSDNVTSSQNNFNNLINFQKSTTSKF